MTSDLTDKRKASEDLDESALDDKKPRTTSNGKGKAVEPVPVEEDEDDEEGADYVEGQPEEAVVEEAEEEDEEEEDEDDEEEGVGAGKDLEEGEDDEEEDEDDLAEIDTSNVIQGRRTRGKKIDFEKLDKEIDNEVDSVTQADEES